METMLPIIYKYILVEQLPDQLKKILFSTHIHRSKANRAQSAFIKYRSRHCANSQQVRLVNCLHIKSGLVRVTSK